MDDVPVEVVALSTRTNPCAAPCLKTKIPGSHDLVCNLNHNCTVHKEEEWNRQIEVCHYFVAADIQFVGPSESEF